MTIRWLLVLVLTACGSSSGSTDGPPGNHDDAGKKDAPSYYPFACATGSACTTDDVCCTMPGASTTFGCVAIASCPMADRISCDGPGTCGGSTPVCCGVDVPDGTGSFPQCGVASLGTSCTTSAACPTHLANSCTDTTKVQLCKVKADCTDATNNKCCTFASGAASLTFCIDGTTASLGGATCHP
jgi:hypothetical protein